jgi:GTPase
LARTPSAGRSRRTEETVAQETRTLVVGPYLSGRRSAREDGSARSAAARFEEAVGLARAIDLDVVGAELANLSEIRPATFIGKGKVEAIAERAEETGAGLVVMDCALSPVQQRNLEKAFSAKVIDRTGLILEIFGRRARTKEGALQVELAHLAYQKSRLVRSWTHLERQRGGFGFLGGPGETQIESDRRLIQERMIRIERDLEGVKKTRGLHRTSRRAVPYSTVALVGYTNAGKSTLFNRLTKAAVSTRDMLFATLDPTMRALKLPHGGVAILSDTVGFISDLPTMLISAFRATLEEVLAADLILHVRDIAHADTAAQSLDVAAILDELGCQSPVIEVWNKLDKLDGDHRAALLTNGAARNESFAVSALTGEGIDALLAEVQTRLSQGRSIIDLDVDAADGQGLHWLYENAEVMARDTAENGSIRLRLRIAPDKLARLARRFPGAAAT